MRIHFISGLPRSGSTLLEGILRQNPRFQAGISGPLAEMFSGLVRSMSGANESAIFISDSQRRGILKGLFDSYYADLNDRRLIFDTHRGWCAHLPALVELFPEARMICCVRNPAWILDSIEANVQRNPFGAQRMFNFDGKGNVYTRAEILMGKDGFVRRSLGNLRQAWFGEFADRLIVVPYDSLVANPGETIRRLYDTLGENAFVHDFNCVEYDEPQFDANLGLPGFHRISGPVRVQTRHTILPPDIFRQYNECFWTAPDQNPRCVLTL